MSQTDQPTSTSFKIAVGVAIFVALAFVTWQFIKPNPVGESDMVVRRYSAAIAEKMGPFRKAVRDVQRESRDNPELRAAAKDRIDQLARELNDRIEDLTDVAVAEIESISGLGLRTQENRLSRLRRLALEGRARIGQVVAEAKVALDAEDAP